MAFYYIFHTSSGLSKLSSSLTQKISQEIAEEVRVDIKEISFSLSKIKMTIMINESLELVLSGWVSPLDEVYDVKYHVKGDEIVSDTVHFKDKVDIKGTIKGKKEDFKLQGEGIALEGKVRFSLHHQAKKEKDIHVEIHKMSAAKFFKLVGRKPLFAGAFSLEAALPLYSKFEKEGDITLDIHRAGVYLQNIREAYGIQFPDDFMLSGTGHLHLSNAIHTFDAKVKTTIADVSVRRGKITEVNKKLTALYHLKIEELSKLQFLSKKRYGGAFVADGELEYLDGLRFDGQSASLGGKMDYYYEKGTLEAKLEALSLVKLFRAMYYPPIMIGDISGKAEVDIDKNVAVVNLRSPNLHFRRNALIETIYHASSVDIAKEIFTKSYFTSTIENGIVFYDFKAENKTSHIYLLDAKMDAVQNSIDSSFDIKMQGEALSGEVYGSLKSPQVTLNVAKYIEFKAKKEIDEFFGVGTSEKVKKELDDVDMDDVKGFIKGFF